MNRINIYYGGGAGISRNWAAAYILTFYAGLEIVMFHLSCEELTLWKDPDAGRDWGQEEKGTTEDEMAGWHHRHDGHEFE